MEILLDTSFILSCVDKKIDFVYFIENNFSQNISFLIPKEVISEILGISNRPGEKEKNKKSAKIALDIINKSEFKKISLNTNNVDNGIVKYILKNPQLILATNDKELGERAKCKILKIRGEKKIELF